MRSNFSGKPWSDGFDAPEISSRTYLSEKSYFAGIVIGAMFYGFAVVLFFRCASALLSPTNRTREGIRWGLVAYTTAVFSFVTILTAMNLNIQSISYIDNREFPNLDDPLPPGPYGYLLFINSNAINVVPNIMFLLNTWLTDGLLLYRCCIIYAMNYWVIAFPCLMYLASLATGITFIYYEASQPVANQSPIAVNFDYPYFAISLSLNILLAFMIITRLVLRSGGIQNATGGSGLYKAILTMLVESFALYAVSYLLFIGPWSADSPSVNIFFQILTETQVIAPFLIVLRVADRRALTSEIIPSGNASSTHSSLGETTGGDWFIPSVHPMTSMSMDKKIPGEVGIVVETNISRISS